MSFGMGISPTEVEDLQVKTQIALAKSLERIVVPVRLLHRLIHQYNSAQATVADLSASAPICSICGCITAQCTCKPEERANIKKVKAWLEGKKDDIAHFAAQQSAYEDLGYVLPRYYSQCCASNCPFMYEKDKPFNYACTLTFQVLERGVQEMTRNPAIMRCQRCLDIEYEAENARNEERVELDEMLCLTSS